MKNHVWSVKLAAAVGVLVASVALAGQGGQSNETTLDDLEDFQVIPLQEPPAPAVVPQPQPGSIRMFGAPPDGRPEAVLLQDVNPARVKPPKYRIGVSCHGPIPEAIRHQLNLSDKQGVIVVEVLPDSPAAKAGLEKHDILVSGNDHPLDGVVDLIEVVEAAEGKSVKFVVVRKGKEKTIEVTPEENPHWKSPEEAERSTGVAPPYPELDRVLEWFERTHPRGARPSMRLRFMHPGIILAPDALIHPTLPGGMSITILKKGDERTQITVKRGEEEWKVDEKGIDQLPDDIRPYVERMLHGMVLGSDAVAPRLDFLPDWQLRRPPADEARPPVEAQPRPSARDRIEQRMDQMNQRLQKLQEMMERLHRETGPEQEK
ncbi:MAG: PDZ domain-containing protein [Pirellulaceae bacterium]|nr:PDZ domain-containing protein [Pirellulaceae bacterium]